MKQPVIYILIDPTTAEVRYVGWTIKPLVTRLRAHVSEARCNASRYKNKWVRSLLAADLKPIIWPIESTRNYEDRERFWIAHYQKAGCRLTNGTDGGGGAWGRRHTVETRAKMSQCARQRPPPSPEARRRMSAAGRGRVFSDEHRRKISAALKGRPTPWIPPKKPRPVPQGPACGERASGAKLNWEQVRAIRAEAPSVSHRQLAEKYGVRKCQIVNILRGRDWKDPDYVPETPRPSPQGERNSNAKLDWDSVRELRAEPLPHRLGSLAAKYSISKASVSLILRGLHWKEQSE